MKILHSFPEKESKFLTHFNALFQISSIENKVVKSLKSGYVKEKYDLVIVHNLRPKDAKFIAQGKIQEKIIWFSWGTDIYKLPNINASSILPLTNKKYLSIDRCNVKKLADLIFGKKAKHIRKYTTYRHYKKAILKIDTMIPVIKSEYILIRDSYNSKLKYFDLNYPVIEDNYSDNYEKKIFAIVGNSAAIWNNHFDLFERLSSNPSIKQGKVYLPLSYGATERWISFIKSEANELFGDAVVFIDQLMSKVEYDKLILQSEVMIMYHIRQSAMGNILMALDNSVHVYLNEENPIYEYLITKGFVLSTVSRNTRFVPLDPAQSKHNRVLVRKIYGLRSLQVKLDRLIQTMHE